MCQVTAYGRQTVPDRGVVTGQVMWPIKNVEGSNNITGKAEPKVVKFCTQVGYINFSNKMTYHPQSGRGYGHMTVYKFCRLPWCSASRGFVSDSWLYLLHLVLPFMSSLQVIVDTSNLVYRLNMASPGLQMINRPWNGRDHVTWTLWLLENKRSHIENGTK